MPVTRQPQVSNLDRVWPNIANQRRTNQKAVTVILDAAPVVVVVQTSMDCVALANEVLPGDVCDVDILMARVETIKTAVGVLLEHREVGGIELNAIIVGSSDQPQS